MSAVPNHQNGRITSMETRFNIAMRTFGYELDPRQLSSEEKAIIKDQVAFYKKNRQLPSVWNLLHINLVLLRQCLVAAVGITRQIRLW